MLRRETIIALRARHSAFRVAADVMFPPQAAPEPVLEEVEPPPPLPTPEQAAEVIAAAEARREWVEQVVRRSEREWQRKERRRRRGERMFAIIFVTAWALFISSAIAVGTLQGMKDRPAPTAPPSTATN